MKISATLLDLALCVLLPGRTTAFFVPSPKAFKTALYSDAYDEALKNAMKIMGKPKSESTTSGASESSETARTDADMSFKDIWDTCSPVRVQGRSLRTWAVEDHSVERVQVLMKTDGRPMSANVKLWQGPDNTPQKMRIYIEDGDERPFSAIVQTPKTGENAIAIYNTGNLEFPLSACVEPDVEDALANVTETLSNTSTPVRVQGGGSVKTYPFESAVESVQILLTTDGRPLNARMELLQGPNNNKQVIEVYTEDGTERPFFIVIQTPGIGNVVRLINTGPMEFPLDAIVEPYKIDPNAAKIVRVESRLYMDTARGGESWWSGPF